MKRSDMLSIIHDRLIDALDYDHVPFVMADHILKAIEAAGMKPPLINKCPNLRSASREYGFEWETEVEVPKVKPKIQVNISTSHGLGGSVYQYMLTEEQVAKLNKFIEEELREKK